LIPPIVAPEPTSISFPTDPGQTFPSIPKKSFPADEDKNMSNTTQVEQMPPRISTNDGSQPSRHENCDKSFLTRAHGGSPDSEQRDSSHRSSNSLRFPNAAGTSHLHRGDGTNKPKPSVDGASKEETSVPTEFVFRKEIETVKAPSSICFMNPKMCVEEKYGNGKRKSTTDKHVEKGNARRV